MSCPVILKIMLSLMIICDIGGPTLTGEQRLLNDVMMTYDKRIRPLRNSSDTVTVNLEFSINSIKEFV